MLLIIDKGISDFRISVIVSDIKLETDMMV